MQYGIIKQGKLKGRHIILKPRKNLTADEYLVEHDRVFGGQPVFAKYCIKCENPVWECNCRKTQIKK